MSTDPRSTDPRVAAFAGSHLLLLDPDLEPTDVVSLLRNLRPDLPAGEPMPGEPSVKSYRITRHSQIVGPFAVDQTLRDALGLPVDVSALFALECPRDREPVPPPEWLPDIDGLIAAFPRGLPCKEEGRVLDEIIAVARRLRLAVRLADEPVRQTEDGTEASAPRARILHPDLDTHPNLFIYSQYWLQPDVLLHRVATIAPQARWPRPPRQPEVPVPGSDEPVELDGYAIEIPLEEQLGPRAGFVEIQVGVDEYVPSALRAHMSGEQVVYTLRWVDTDSLGRLADIDEELRDIRRQVITLMERCAAEVMTSVAGAGVDESGFLVSAQQLRG